VTGDNVTGDIQRDDHQQDDTSEYAQITRTCTYSNNMHARKKVRGRLPKEIDSRRECGDLKVHINHAHVYVVLTLFVVNMYRIRALGSSYK